MRTIAVTSAVPERRRAWAHVLGTDGARIVECSGPLVDCPLARGELECALLANADLAVYDLDSIIPMLVPALMRKHAGLNMIFARDALSPGGEHRPSIQRIHLAGPSRAVCFGAP